MQGCPFWRLAHSCALVMRLAQRVYDVRHIGEEHVTVASVDADKHRKLGERYDVSGFPTLKLFPSGGGDPEPYSGGRDLDTLVAFINEKAGTDIAADGGLVDGGGVVHELRDTLHSFVKSTSDEERLDLLSQCSKKIGKAWGGREA
eukprot:IDg16328t1